MLGDKNKASGLTRASRLGEVRVRRPGLFNDADLAPPAVTGEGTIQSPDVERRAFEVAPLRACHQRV
jgi:hypothetical protein